MIIKVMNLNLMSEILAFTILSLFSDRGSIFLSIGGEAGQGGASVSNTNVAYEFVQFISCAEAYLLFFYR